MDACDGAQAGRAHPGDVRGVGVRALGGGLVGAPEADLVGDQHAVPEIEEVAHHVAVEVTPGRLAVEEEDGSRSVTRAFVEVCHAKRIATGRVLHIRVLGSEGKIGKIGKSLVGCS